MASSLKNKISFLILLHFFILNNATSQRIFICDSVAIHSSHTYIGECNYFYNFLSEVIDSVYYLSKGYGSIIYKPINIVADFNSEGKIVGKVKGFIDSSLFFETYYKSGVIDSYYVQYNGIDTLGYVFFKLGKKEGEQIFYLDSNEVIKQIFKKGRKEGPLQIIKNGKVMYYCNYKSGEKEGAEYQLYDTGELQWCLVNSKNKVIDGIYYSFTVDGFVETEMHFKEGKIVKTVYYEDGKIIRIRE